MIYRFLAVLIGVALAWPATMGLAQERWPVALTKRQAAKFEEQKSHRGQTAMAISPDGPWGRGRGFSTTESAQEWALQGCRAYLKPGRRDCFIYGVNGAVVAPAVVQVSKVTAVYKPVHGNKAAAYFGLSPFAFSGDRAAVQPVLEQIAENREVARGLIGDESLKRALLGKSIALTGGRGTSIWFGADAVEITSQTKSEYLRRRFREWVVTSDGLICLYDGAYRLTGKRVGTNCLFLESAQGGKVVFSWMNSPKSKRKALMIAGNAGLGAAK